MKLAQVVIWGMGLACSISVAAAETIWAAGADKGGWYDVDKSLTDTRDDNMCYVAAAANLIAWWQNSDSGRKLSSSAPSSHEDIWNFFLDYSRNHQSGGDQLAAINWWISGVYVPVNEQEAQRSLYDMKPEDDSVHTLYTFPGFYFDRYGLCRDDLEAFLSLTVEYTPSTLGDLLSGGAGVSLMLKSESGGLQHAITLWGADYTAAGALDKLWVTDSDDGVRKLFSIDVRTADNGRVYFDSTRDIGHYDAYEMFGISGIYIYGLGTIHPEAAASWQLVPEPAAATLSRLALAGLAARRRR